MRDWIRQATEADLRDLDLLIAGGPLSEETAGAVAGGKASRWTARTLGEVAAFFALQLQTVKEWRTGPDPMPGQEGAWPLDTIVAWRFAKLQFSLRRAEGKGTLETDQLEIANARSLIKLRNEAGALISREAAKAAVAQMFHRLRGQIEQLADILATSVPNAARGDFLIDARARVRIFLVSLANWRFDAELPSPESKGTACDTATASNMSAPKPA